MGVMEALEEVLRVIFGFVFGFLTSAARPESQHSDSVRSMARMLVGRQASLWC